VDYAVNYRYISEELCVNKKQTGSWDYQGVLNYKFQKNKIAVLLNTDYTIKTENQKHYRFGK